MKALTLRLLLVSFFIFLLSENKAYAVLSHASDTNRTVEATQKRLTLKVEGLRLLDETSLYDALDADYPSRFAFWKEKKATIKAALLPSLDETLRAFLDSEGFYDANYTVHVKGDTLYLFIEENEPVRIYDINISSDFDLDDAIVLKKGEIFKAKDFVASKSNIIDALLEEGYCSYDLDTKAYVDLQKHRVDTVIFVRKGEPCKFGDATVNGAKSVSSKVILSRVRARKGDRFDLEAVKETSSALYGLEAFDSVRVDVSRKFYNVIPVDIYLKEMEKPYHIELGAGYDTYAGPRIHGRFVKHNFFGDAQLLTLKASWSSQEQLLVGEYFKPVLFEPFGWWIDYGAHLGYSNLEYDGFREEKSFFKNYLSHDNGVLRIDLGVALEHIVISRPDNDVVLLPEYAYDDFNLFYPYVNIRYDKRDSKLNPTKGYYLSLYTEYGLPSNDESSLYLKWEVEGRFIRTFSHLTTAIVGKLGTVKIYDESSKGIPESKKFFGGGSFSNRAYGYKELGVITSSTSDLINGALSMANLSIEADYPIRGALYGAVFCDNTMLNADSYDFRGDVITSAGIGVRYMTPVGPFKLDVAFNVHDTSQYGIVFQIGQSF